MRDEIVKVRRGKTCVEIILPDMPEEGWVPLPLARCADENTIRVTVGRVMINPNITLDWVEDQDMERAS